MVKILRTNICERFPNCKTIVDVKFNMNMPTNMPFKLLLYIDYNSLLTFNVNTLEFSALFKLSVYYTQPFYCYHNVLKEVIITVDTLNFVVYVIKETSESLLYIYKKINLSIGDMTDIAGASCCYNRNNEVILFLFTAENNDIDVIEEERVENSTDLFMYDVLNDKMHSKLFGPSMNHYLCPVFFNGTCEEIFISDINHLWVFVTTVKFEV